MSLNDRLQSLNFLFVSLTLPVKVLLWLKMWDVCDSWEIVYKEPCCNNSNFRDRLLKTHTYFHTECVMAFQGHPMSFLPRFRDIAVFCWKQPSHPYSTWNLVVLPWGIADLGAPKCEDSRPIVCVITFKANQPIWSRYLKVTEGQTFQQTVRYVTVEPPKFVLPPQKNLTNIILTAITLQYRHAW